MKKAKVVGIAFAVLVLGGLGAYRLSRPKVPEVPTAEGGPRPAGVSAQTSGKMRVLCMEPARPISPRIYGVAFADGPKALGATQHRWGGNTTSRYNPELASWNTATDWFFQNVKIDSTKNLPRQGREGWRHRRGHRADARLGREGHEVVFVSGGRVRRAGEGGSRGRKEGPGQRRDLGRGGAHRGSDPRQREEHARDGEGVEYRGCARPTRRPASATSPSGSWTTSRRSGTRPTGTCTPGRPPTTSCSRRPCNTPRPCARPIPRARSQGPSAWGWPKYLYSAKDAEGDSLVAQSQGARRRAPSARVVPAQSARRGREGPQALPRRARRALLSPGRQHPEPGHDQHRQRRLHFAAPLPPATRALWDKSYLDESYIRENRIFLIRA